MGRILLCMGKYAEHPYYIDSVPANVYCVEELCYLFVSNPFMIDRDIMDKNLAKWLDLVCGLSELTHQLLGLFNRGTQPGVFVSTILDYVNYCTPEDKKKIEDVLQSNIGLNNYEKQKRQADFLLKNKGYSQALNEYDELLRALPETESALKPPICHNMGVIYANLYQFEMAARYFKRAYDMAGNEESGIAYLAARRLHLSENAYIDFIAKHGGEFHELSLQVEKRLNEAKGEFEASQENRMLSALKFYKDEGNVASYYDDIDQIIMKKEDEYRELVLD